MPEMKVLSIIIPVYNEAKTTAEILKQVDELKLNGVSKEIVIVESNSKDNSREVCQTFAKNRPYVKLILEDGPHGKGHAVRAGFQAATGDIILIQDADLEYDVNDYQKLIDPILAGQTKFVLGSRHMGVQGRKNWQMRQFKNEKAYALLMNVGTIGLHGFFNLLYGTKLTDPTTMYKVFKRELLDYVNFQGNYFELDFEIVSKFVRLGFIPLELPIEYYSRGPAEGKKVNLKRDVFKWLKMILMCRLVSLENKKHFPKLPTK